MPSSWPPASRRDIDHFLRVARRFQNEISRELAELEGEGPKVSLDAVLDFRPAASAWGETATRSPEALATDF